MSAPKGDSLTNDLLFEIGTEELPATNLADLFESAGTGPNLLEERLRKTLEEKRLVFGSVKAWATPRRLVFLVKDLAAAQTAKDQMIRLLAAAEAYGPDGKATEKLLGILKHRQAGVSDLVTADSGGKDYVFIKKAEPVQRTTALLPELLDGFVRAMGFPKNMKWDDSGVFFPRPIRGYLCYYGAKPVKLKIGLTSSAPKTVFFSKARRKSVAVKSIPAYFTALKKQGVTLDPAERKQKIRRLLDEAASSMKARLYEDPFLLSEVNFLVEDPHPLTAPFGEEFLHLPLEVLTVSMARKQRIFGVLARDGKVLPRFIAVLDGPASASRRKAISTNIENILHAKLQDSLFFYREDLKVPLSKKREELRTLVFLKGAGSMYEKSERLVRLVPLVCGDAQVSRALERACLLAKADLLTLMVGEFPELQGIIGRYYAQENGEDAAVAAAIGEQYLPRTAADRLPETHAGALLSVLDKADLVAACFAMGMEPSSSLDPYGLRRSATAVLKILVDKKIQASLPELLAAVDQELFKAFSKNWKQPEQDAPKRLARLLAFFKDRFKALLADRGYSEELIEAAMATRFDRPLECFERVQAMAGLSGTEELTQASKVVERTVNILKGRKEALPQTIDPGLFDHELERAVHERYQAAAEGIREAARRRDFAKATSLYAEAFFDILNQFFEKVFVNAEDPAVRQNRLALLKAVKDLYVAEIADLSKIRPSAPPADGKQLSINQQPR